MTIRHDISALDEHEKAEAAEKKQSATTLRFQHIYLGAPQQPMSLGSMEQAYASEPQFTHFRKSLTDFVNTNFPRPNKQWQVIPKEFMVSNGWYWHICLLSQVFLNHL